MECQQPKLVFSCSDTDGDDEEDTKAGDNNSSARSGSPVFRPPLVEKVCDYSEDSQSLTQKLIGSLSSKFGLDHAYSKQPLSTSATSALFEKRRTFSKEIEKVKERQSEVLEMLRSSGSLPRARHVFAAVQDTLTTLTKQTMADKERLKQLRQSQQDSLSQQSQGISSQEQLVKRAKLIVQHQKCLVHLFAAQKEIANSIKSKEASLKFRSEQACGKSAEVQELGMADCIKSSSGSKLLGPYQDAPFPSHAKSMGNRPSEVDSGPFSWKSAISVTRTVAASGAPPVLSRVASSLPGAYMDSISPVGEERSSNLHCGGHVSSRQGAASLPSASLGVSGTSASAGCSTLAVHRPRTSASSAPAKVTAAPAKTQQQQELTVSASVLLKPVQQLTHVARNDMNRPMLSDSASYPRFSGEHGRPKTVSADTATSAKLNSHEQTKSPKKSVSRKSILQDIMSAGIMAPGENCLSLTVKGNLTHADLLPDGVIRASDGELFETPEEWIQRARNVRFTKATAWRLVKYLGKPILSFMPQLRERAGSKGQAEQASRHAEADFDVVKLGCESKELQTDALHVVEYKKGETCNAGASQTPGVFPDSSGAGAISIASGILQKDLQMGKPAALLHVSATSLSHQSTQDPEDLSQSLSLQMHVAPLVGWDHASMYSLKLPSLVVPFSAKEFVRTSSLFPEDFWDVPGFGNITVDESFLQSLGF